MMRNEATIKDALYNAHPDCTKAVSESSLPGEILNGPIGVVYGRGIVNGVVSAIMALQGCTFKSALKQVKRLAPQTDIKAIPPCWRDDWKGIDV